jgi:hypothetical protein
MEGEMNASEAFDSLREQGLGWADAARMVDEAYCEIPGDDWDGHPKPSRCQLLESRIRAAHWRGEETKDLEIEYCWLVHDMAERAA